MIAGAVAGGALAAWIATAVAARLRRTQVRRRLELAVAIADGTGDVGATPRRGTVTLGHVTVRPRSAFAVRRTASARRAAAGRGATGRGGGGTGRRAADLTDGDADAGLAETCDAISRALRSGRSLPIAVVEAADRHHVPAVAELARAIEVGEPLSTSLDRLLARSPDPDVLLVGQVLAVAAEHGGSPAEAIDRAAATLRERDALRAERRAQAASARLSTRVLTVLPFAFTGFVAATDDDVRRVLLRTPVGWTCLLVGAGLNLAGRAWTKRAVAA